MTHWFRFGRFGPGIVWKRANAPMLFSERYGYSKSWVLFGWRFRILGRIK